MKVELQCGDTITIPEGCKVIVKGGSVVFKKEKKKENRKKNFKEGDVLHSILGNTMLIFKATGSDNREDFESHYNNTRRNNKHWNIYAFRHATEDEKQFLFNKMKKQGLQWNAEEKRVEKIRWRAGIGEEYFSFDIALRVQQFIEANDTYNNAVYDALNYFRTKEQNEEAARRVKETLRKYHEELGYY